MGLLEDVDRLKVREVERVAGAVLVGVDHEHVVSVGGHLLAERPETSLVLRLGEGGFGRHGVSRTRPRPILTVVMNAGQRRDIGRDNGLIDRD